MSASNAFETDLLNLIFRNVAAAGIGDGAGLLGSGVDGDLYVSLHTADPGETGDQSTNECTYGAYSRVAVARPAGWSVSGNGAENATLVQFPQATGGSETATHFGIGTSLSGAGKLLFKGALVSSLAISLNVTPEFQAGEIDITND